MNRLVLIDGKSVFYRGYYAMGNLSLPDGTPTGGIYGFAAISMEIVKRLNPTKVIVAWDSKTSVSKRRALYPEYKAGRVKPGDDFYAQIPLLKNLILALGWSFVEVDDYEADDIIGTFSREADETLGPDGKCEYETYIISSDLDMLQIVDENTHMWRIVKGFSNIEKIDIAEIEAKYGIKKSQFLDLKALKGDASDNIPGVPGVGEKTAAKLLNDYGTLDGVYENLDQITGSTRTKLEAGKDSAYLSQRLAKIMFDAPVDLAKIPDFVWDHERVISALKDLQFNSLIRKFELGNKGEDASVSRAAKGVGGVHFETVRDNGSGLSEEPRNDGRDEASRKMSDSTPIPEIIDWDIKALMHSNQEIAQKILNGTPFWDLSQAAFLLNPLARDEAPKLVVPAEEYQRQLSELSKTPKLLSILKDFDLPLIPVLYKMEDKGMLIDRDYFKELEKSYTDEVRQKEREIYQLAGAEFNVNSPMQLSEILFTKLNLPTKGIKKTTRGYSTGAKELDKLKDLHPVVPKIIEYREAAKLLSTYIIPMTDYADENDRIHTTFTQNVTATGRLSSLNPNLQNIPVRTEAGRKIRAGFIAPKGRILVSADYSQFELRLAAALSNDQNLMDDFASGVDIHTKTASEAFNVPMDQVTKAQRRSAKVINFGVLYGMGTKSLADAAEMSFAEAKNFIEEYFKLRAPIKQKLADILHQAETAGYVETFYGRRRPTPDVKSPNFMIRESAKRAAMNMPIQGTEADLMKRAMINISQALPEGADIIMQVHDSLIVECDESQAPEITKILKEKMESVAPELKVKLAVDVTTGQNWGEL